MIKLSAIDLNYLLSQVNILTDYNQLVSPLDPNGVREVSGTNNNLVGGFQYNIDGTVTWTGNNINGDWGQADTDFLRLFQTNHPDTGIPQYGVTYDPTVKIAAIDANGQAPTIDDPLNPGTPIQNPAWIPTFVDNPMQMVTQADGESTRTIAQLISSSDVDPNSPTYNPAAAAAMEALGGQAVSTSNTVVGNSVTAEMPNPGILGGVPYNEWFVAFGQFFDHGLDFITKGAGYVLIPLSPSDPLFNPAATGPMANKMMLSRASISNGPADFYLDPATGNMHLMNGVTPQFNNNTGLLIDQSQTYGSHASVNALVRQYDANGVVTGALITGAEDGTGNAHDLGKWADMQANALRIGIELIDMDVLGTPMIKADAVGRITFDVIPSGTLPPGMGYRSDETLTDMAARTGVDAATLAQYDPFERLPDGTVMQSNQAILADIAHGASPLSPMGVPLQPASSITDFTGMIPGVHFYDDAALAQHFVSGDGRVNENAGLTAVHHVFHEEHNIQVQQIKDQVTAIAQELYVAEFAASGDAGAAQAAADAYKADWEVSPGIWDGEKLYQAARIITESEYNHIAIDQYVAGLYPMLPEFVSYSSDINMSVSLEFSQAVFRLGHSQLTETVQIALPDDNGVLPGEPGYIAGNFTEVDLFEAFLNPAVYDAHGAAAIALGLINQTGNELDEFVTSALQQSLVGVPLDLAALNLARSRDVGLPTLNELRQQVFDGLTQNTNNNSNGSGIAPYTSWEDFGGHLRTPESLVNFIAAYGRDDAIFGLQSAREAYEAGTMTLQELRAKAQVILDAAANTGHPLHDAATMFLRGTGEPKYNSTTEQWEVNADNGGDQGFWDIDLWIGGLAEQPLFDGPLGTTFSFVMLDFAQRMQDGDRFYYLYRMPTGHHLGDQIIGEQFADLVMRTTGLEHINGDVFGQASATFILDGLNHDNPRDGTTANSDDAYGINDYFNAIYETLPDSVKQFVLANSSFEAQALGNGLGTTNTNGTYLSGNPDYWTLTQGGIWAPDTETAVDTDFVVNPAGMSGSQVAYITGTGTLSQDVDATATEGATYTLSFALGNREDRPTSSVHAYLYAGTTLLADTIAQNSGDGWINVSFDTSDPMSAYGPIDAAVAGQQLRIVIQKLSDATVEDAGATQVLIDNVSLTESTPGGSANDGHIVVAGLEGNDYIVGALGDDTIYGGDGNDIIEGAQGNDHLYGGDGDDWITDYENDDFIAGGPGNDYVSAGPGVLDTVFGNDGDDELHGGDGIDMVFGDDGDDMLFGEGDTDLLMGGEGNDYVDGGDSVDEVFGGNGNDWLRGGVGDDNLNGGSGNDLMEGGLGAVANDGDRLNGDTLPGALPVIEWNGDGTEGDMDIASYEEVPIAVIASLQTSNFNGTSSNLLDTYALNEGIVGSAQDDQLEGADDGGLANNGPRNQLIGGAGNDRLSGLGDTDWLFGDTAVVRNNLWIDLDATKALAADGTLVSTYDATTNPTGYEVIENWRGTGEFRVLFHNADGSTDLGHILGDNGTAGTADVAVYRGNRADYEVTWEADGRVKVVDTRPLPADPQAEQHDGTDYLWGIEQIEFADGTFDLIDLLNDAPTDVIWNGAAASGLPDAGEVLGTLEVVDPDGTSWTFSTTSANISVSGGVITVINAMADNHEETFDITATDEYGASYTETFRIKVANGGADIIGGSAGSDIIFARGNNDTVSAGDGDDIIYGQNGNDTLNGGAGNDVLWGIGQNDSLSGNAGDDVILGGDGNDTVTWNFGDGSDIVDGGTGSQDTFIVNDNGMGGSFVITAVSGAANASSRIAIETAHGALEAGTEIVIERDGVLIAQLDNIEELVVNAVNVTANDGGGLNTGVSVSVEGEFSTTSLNYSTITVNGDDGDDTVDISGLGSGHRVVFHGGGGTNTFIGGQRPQDVVENAGYGSNMSGGDTSGIGDTGGDQGGSTGPAFDVPGALMLGGEGADVLVGTDDDNLVIAGGGNDVVLGGDGNDMLFADAGQDRVFGGDGDDWVVDGDDDGGDYFWGGAGNDTLDYSGHSDDIDVDLGSGFMGHGQVKVGTGHDAIFGFENAVTGSGNDKITANSAVNVMDGGDGDNVFVFRSATDADGDHIVGFNTGDTIDLSGIDADQTTAGHQSFVLFTNGGLNAAGQLNVTYEMHDDGEHTIVSGNVTGGDEADFEIDIAGHHTLSASDSIIS